MALELNIHRANLGDLAHINFIDNDFLIFDDLSSVEPKEYPIRVDAAIFAMCTSGSARLSINLNEYEIRKGDLLSVMPDHIIQGYERSVDFSGLFIVVSRTFIEDVLPKLDNLLPFFFYVKENPITALDEEEAECIREYYSFLLKKVKVKDNPYRREVAQSLLQALFYDTMNIFKRHIPQTNIKKSRRDEIFAQFMHLVVENFKQDRSVLFYADKMCLTPKHLSSAIKQVSGQTAGEWIDNYVILAAKVLLKSTAKNIQEISSELNFANQSFFGKYFKQHTGISPREYRKQER